MLYAGRTKIASNKLFFRNLHACSDYFQPQTLIFLYSCGVENCSVSVSILFKFWVAINISVYHIHEKPSNDSAVICILCTVSWLFSFNWSKAFAKQSEDIVYLVHLQSLLPLLQIPHEMDSHTGPVCQFLLGKVLLLAQALHMFR